MVLTKQLCKVFDINNAYRCTLNSYAISLLSIFFLQIAYGIPSILLTSDVDFDRRLSLSTVLTEMFFYYGYVFDFDTNVISVRLGKIAKKQVFDFKAYNIKNNTVICIEDPVQNDFNVTRTVNISSLKKIIKVFRLAHHFMLNHNSSFFEDHL